LESFEVEKGGGVGVGENESANSSTFLVLHE